MSELPAKLDLLEKVGELHLKSYKPAEIARRLDISPAQAKSLIRDYQEVLANRVSQDPEFLDRIAENTIEALERMDDIVAEANLAYETAKDNEMINQQIGLLKLRGDLEDKRAKLLQLMGAKIDSGMMARMNKAERVNEIVTRTIKEVVGDCPKCRVEVMPALAEAFSLMNKMEEAAEMTPVDDDIIDVEVVEEEEVQHDHSALMANVLSDE